MTTRSDDRHARILSVAAELFATRGYSGTGVDEIGEAVGVTGPALYRHFANKQALLDEIVLSGQRALLDDAIAVVRDGLSPMKTLERLVEVRVQFAQGTYRHAFAISHASDTQLSEAAQRQVRSVQDLYKAEWLRVLSQVRPTATTVELQAAWYASHMLIGYTAQGDGTRDADEHQRHTERMALAVLLA